MLAAVASPAAARRDGPGKPVVSAPDSVYGHAADVTFTAAGGHDRFVCRLGRSRWQTCRSPVRLVGLRRGRNVFLVRVAGGPVARTVIEVIARTPDGSPPDRPPASGADTGSAGSPAPGGPANAPGSSDAQPTAAPDLPPAAPRPATDTSADADGTNGTMFSDPFAGPDDVITNHYAMWNGHDDPNAHRSVNYEVESGTLYRQDGVATTGLPTWAQPLTADSSDGSGNDIFRMWTRRSDFGNDYVHMRLRFDGWTEGHAPEWPAQPWDGVKIWLRRSGASGSYALYTAEVSRRQGNVMIQKKCAGSDAYTVLAQSKDNRPVETGLWETVGGGAYNDSNGTVLLGVVRDGKLVLTARDSGAGGCDPITAPGRVGVRGDNARFAFDDLTITSLDRGTTTAQPAPAPPHARGAP